MKYLMDRIENIVCSLLRYLRKIKKSAFKKQKTKIKCLLKYLCNI